MPKYIVEMLRWEPQSGTAEVEANSAAEAIKLARDDAKEIGPILCAEWSPDTTVWPRIRILSVTKEPTQ